ncbi:hypothetical protein HMPREF1981_00893 [Bacteroides pyogenes F0041]|uniref:Uncharacterized protein n=1 Tax=Bacteroides pyogenes F0041 TaxID=1321819 RepID=U2CR21_9BACE|nr:hypothetical protein HMPREF1981_00893 [Bacteroides pyogenes F0041]
MDRPAPRRETIRPDELTLSFNQYQLSLHTALKNRVLRSQLFNEQ